MELGMKTILIHGTPEDINFKYFFVPLGETVRFMHAQQGIEAKRNLHKGTMR